MEKADIWGIVSGKEVDKSKKLEIFYEEQDRVPLIGETPVNAVCELREM